MTTAWSDKQLAASLSRIRAICLALPEATEELTWETTITFRIRKKIFCFPADGGSLTVKADQDEFAPLMEDPRFSPPPYLTRGNWVRMDLQAAAVDWTEVTELIHTSYVLIAPKKLGALVEG